MLGKARDVDVRRGLVQRHAPERATNEGGLGGIAKCWGTAVHLVNKRRYYDTTYFEHVELPFYEASATILMQ